MPPAWFSCGMARSAPNHGDGLAGVDQDGVAHARGHQGHADGLLARAGLDHGHLVGQQPQHRDLHGGIRTGDAAVATAVFLAHHAITPGASTPGCSKNTCTSSQSTWYAVTCSSLTTRGSGEAATRR